jgi:hypothetical protein
MKRKDRQTEVRKATPAERRIIAELTRKSAFERLDAGESEIVPDYDWENAPQVSETPSLRLPPELYRRLKAASRSRHTTPSRLAVRLLNKELSAM